MRTGYYCTNGEEEEKHGHPTQFPVSRDIFVRTYENLDYYTHLRVGTCSLKQALTFFKRNAFLLHLRLYF
jgi:hypothetical protein